MKHYTLLLLFLVSGMGYNQNTYVSNTSEHWFDESDSEPKKEEMRREIRISKDTITIISYGEQSTDIQKWVQSDRITANSDEGVIEVIPSYLASGRQMEYPATFTIYYKNRDEVDYITCMIPKMAQNSLPDGAPITTKFIIN